jgi:hypothetical protein
VLSSGLDEDKTGGSVGSPGACTCGRGVPAGIAIRVSISQPPKPSHHLLTAVEIIWSWHYTTEYTHRQCTQHNYG